MTDLRASISTFRFPCAAVGLLLLLAASGGCQSMTAHRAAEIAAQIIREEEATKRKEEIERQNEEIRRKNEEIRRKNAELEQRIVRENLKTDALKALQGGEAEEALRFVNQIFDPPPVKKVDPETQEPVLDENGREQLVTAERPKLDKIEEARLRYLQGSILYQLERVDDAIVAFESAVKLDPEYRPARRDFGKLLFREKQYRKALEVWQKELSDGYRDGELLFLIGQARYEVGREEYEKGRQEAKASNWEASRLAFEQARVELLDDDKDFEVKRWLAILNFELQRYEEAVRLFEGIRLEKPLDPTYLEYLANCYIELDDYRKAIDYLELSARLKPPRPAICKSLSDLYAASGLFGRAAEWSVRAYGGSPENATGAEKLAVGLLFMDAGRVDDAIVWLGAIQEADKQYPNAQSNLAYLYKDREQLDEAIAAFDNVRKVLPQDCDANLAIADIHLQRKALEKAEDAYARATGLSDPTCRAEGFAGLAEVAYERGRLQEAIVQYQKALEIQPKSLRFKTALEQIRAEAEYRKGPAIQEDMTASAAP